MSPRRTAVGGNNVVADSREQGAASSFEVAAVALGATAATAAVVGLVARRSRRCPDGTRRSRRSRQAVAAPDLIKYSLEKRVLVPSRDTLDVPEIGDMVKIHYVGYLDDGTIFDSSRYRNRPFEFPLGEGLVIDGWELLIATMALNERSALVIPPEYGYGEEGSPPVIPPNATLFYDVELLDIGKPVEDEGDGGGAEADGDDDEEEEEEEAEPELFWKNDPEREGGEGPGYDWKATGSGKEILISVPMAQDVKLKQVDVDIRSFSVKCKIAGKVIVEGELFDQVIMDDSHWDFERRGDIPVLLIYLAKFDKLAKWKSLLKSSDPPQGS